MSTSGFILQTMETKSSPIIKSEVCPNTGNQINKTDSNKWIQMSSGNPLGYPGA